MMQPDPLQQCDRTFVRYCGRKFSYFSGCDYFRLASDPRVVSAFKRAIDQYGINVAASRFTTGNHDLYRSLERHLASFFDVQDALLVSTGYMSNLVTAQALARSFSHALIDARSHSSLQEAAQLLECPVLMFAHRSPDDVARCLMRCGTQSRPILLTDGLFSHDGSIAPLDRYLQILPPDSLILVDDAHGAGVVGKCGQGAAEHCGVDRKRIVQTITLSKGFGVYGGAILGTTRLTALALQRSHMLVGSTPVPLPLAAAAIESLKLLRIQGSTFRKRMLENTAYVRQQLSATGLELPNNPGPIIAIIPKGVSFTRRFKRALLDALIFPPFIKYPGGPPAGYFRFVISSEHTRKQLDGLVWSISKAFTRKAPRRSDFQSA